MVRNIIYVVLTFTLFYYYSMIMNVVFLYGQALHSTQTLAGFIPYVIIGSIFVNAVSFALVYLTAYNKVFINKKAIKMKILQFIIVQILLVLWYIEIIYSLHIV